MAVTHLRSLQALDLALRTGSLAAAADVLGITPAAVGQRIKALEDTLGIDLLVRGRSGLKATPEMDKARERLATAFRDLETVAAILDLERVHDIQLAAPSDFAELWLAPRLPRFRALYPNIRFCINGEGDAPLRLGRADCEIAFGPSGDAAHTDVFFRDFVLPVGSPENVARIARRPRRDRLEGFPLLHLDFYTGDPAAQGWPEWCAAHGARQTAPRRGMRYPRIAALVEAVRVDAGIAMCGLALVGDLLDTGALALPFPVSTGSWTAHAWAARYRPEGLARAQLRSFRAWLTEEAAATSAWLATKVRGKRRRPSGLSNRC